MANLNYVSPFFTVKNLTTQVSFDVVKLKFEVQYIAPAKDPFFAIVGRDQITIMLKGITADAEPVSNYTRHTWARWDAYISTADPDELFGEFSSAGITFRQPMMVYGDLKLQTPMDMCFFSDGQGFNNQHGQVIIVPGYRNSFYMKRKVDQVAHFEINPFKKYTPGLLMTVCSGIILSNNHTNKNIFLFFICSLSPECTMPCDVLLETSGFFSTCCFNEITSRHGKVNISK